MPIVLFILLVLPFALKNNNKYLLLVSIFSVLTLSITSTTLAYQHTQPTSVAKLRSYFSQINGSSLILSNPLINYYLKSTGSKFDLIDIDLHQTEIAFDKVGVYSNIFMVGDYQNSIYTTFNSSIDTVFFHNPYVNRMWPNIPVYRLSTKIEDE